MAHSGFVIYLDHISEIEMYIFLHDLKCIFKCMFKENSYRILKCIIFWPCLNVILASLHPYLSFALSLWQPAFMFVRFTSGCIPDTIRCVGGCAAINKFNVKVDHVSIRKTPSESSLGVCTGFICEFLPLV